MVGACGRDWINSPMIVSLPIVTHFSRADFRAMDWTRGRLHITHL